MTDAQILDQLTQLVGRKDLTQLELDNWRSGTADGGPAGDGYYPMSDSTGFVRFVPCPAKVAEVAAGMITPKFKGAAPGYIAEWRSELITPQMFYKPGDDWADAIQRAIDAAYEAGHHAIFIPACKGIYWIGTTNRGSIPGGVEDKVRGIIKLRPGVSIYSNGAVLKIAAGDEVKMGRKGPPGLFYHDIYENERCDDVRISGLVMDGNIENQTWDQGAGAEGNGSLAWQYTHAIAMMRGDNFVIDHCKFRGWRGDGAVIGNAFTPSVNSFLCRNARVHHCEFKDIYREGVLFCDVDGGEFSHCYVHGNGYLVAGVDIERHLANETVCNIEVSNCIFDFRDGDAPWERNGPTIPKYRRAVSIGFFYQGYGKDAQGKLLPPDGRANGHKILDNWIYQGCIDSWRHCDVEIAGNRFLSFYEDLTGVRLIRAETILFFDFGGTPGLGRIKVHDNIIDSDMDGDAILVFNYAAAEVYDNLIRRARLSGIRMNFCGGRVVDNYIQDVGTVAARTAAIIIDGTQAGNITVSGNIARDNREGDNRTILNTVLVMGALTKAPLVFGNGGSNLHNPVGAPPAKVALNISGRFDASVNPQVWISTDNYWLEYGNSTGDQSAFQTSGNIQAGDGRRDVQIRLNGGQNSGRSIEFLSAGIQRWSFGTSTQVLEDGNNTGSNFSFYARDDDANYLFNVFKVDRSTRMKDFGDGPFRISGTWQEPFIMGPYTRFWSAGGVLYWNYNQPTSETDGTPVNYAPPNGSWQRPFSMAGSYVWFDPQGGVLRCNYGMPASTSDGRPIGPQPGGTWDYPWPIGGMWMWANPNDGNIYKKSGGKPTSPTDGIVIG